MEKFTTVLLTVFMAMLFTIVMAVIIAYPFMLLWNALMPDIFGMNTITFWQALGLYVLSGFIFNRNYTSNKSDD